MTYDIDGTVMYQDVPPLDFDPLQASNEVLSRHHVPTRPQAAADVSDWVTQMSSFGRTRVKNMCQDKVFQESGSYRYSGNWGGDEVRSQSTYQFDGVKAGYSQPSFSHLSCGTLNTTEDVASWVGIGGDPGALLQTGTVAQDSATSVTYYAFLEMIAANGNATKLLFPSVTVNPGNANTAEVDLTPGTQPTVTFYVTSSGTSGSAYTVLTPTFGVNRGNVEWIDERSVIPGVGFVPLANYGQTHWSSMKDLRTNTGSWYGAYSEPTEWWVEMTSTGYPSGKTLSLTSGTYSDSSMKDTWYACS
jgi:hypothetical protein